MREKGSREVVVESDLGGFRSGNRWEISVGGEKQVPVDQEGGAAAVDSGHSRSLPGENGGLHSLRLAATIAETPRVPQNPHFILIPYN